MSAYLDSLSGAGLALPPFGRSISGETSSIGSHSEVLVAFISYTPIPRLYVRQTWLAPTTQRVNKPVVP